MRYRPAHAAADGRRPSLFRTHRLALTIAFAAVIGLVPAIFVATQAQAAAAGTIDFDSDVEDSEGAAFTFDLRRYGFNMHSAMPDIGVNRIAGGAVDQYLGYTLGVAYVFGGVAPGAVSEEEPAADK